MAAAAASDGSSSSSRGHSPNNFNGGGGGQKLLPNGAAGIMSGGGIGGYGRHEPGSGGVGAGNGTRKREIRLIKNREAARECRRKKKEYIKCLESRVAVLENQNKALIEELKSLNELYFGKSQVTKSIKFPWLTSY